MSNLMRVLGGLLVAILVILGVLQLAEDQNNKELSVAVEGSINPIVSLEKNTYKEVYAVQNGDSLTVIFEKYGVPLNTTYSLLKNDKKKILTKIKPGDKFTFEVEEDEITKIILQKENFESYEIDLDQTNKQIIKLPKQREFVLSYHSGIIKDSFYMGGVDAGMPESIIMDFAYLFGWDIDFVFDVREGDTFFVLYETPFINGTQSANGSILYAEFKNQNQTYHALRFGDFENYAYFDRQGKSLKKAFLRAPLDFAYISSHFNPKRKHPVLNRIKAHNGVDYAANRGTPIRSTGEGVIIQRGTRGGYGNAIEIRHGGEITTLYAHMDRFHPDTKLGSKVKQGQTIGYVGSSGLATGPHLHYEFKVNNKPADPVKVELPSAEPISKKDKEVFTQTLENYEDLLNRFILKEENE
ncbi:MAG: peptidoglycan DD-metalloendopeptidase family protein [Gammaproteobacteria bacterium]